MPPHLFLHRILMNQSPMCGFYQFYMEETLFGREYPGVGQVRREVLATRLPRVLDGAPLPYAVMGKEERDLPKTTLC